MERDKTRNACGIITVAGCKGGVGKSVIASSLAIEAGKCGADVILVDADLGGPNLHTYLGISRPERVLSDFLSRRYRNIEDIVLDHPVFTICFDCQRPMSDSVYGVVACLAVVTV